MEAGYEHQARRLQDELIELTRVRDSLSREAGDIRVAMGGVPRLRDRNRFFNGLLNGDLATLERVKPQWEAFQRLSREVSRIDRRRTAKESAIETVVRRGVKKGDSRYLSLRRKLNREKALERSCGQLVAAIRAARKAIDRAVRSSRSGDSGATVDRAAKEVADRIGVVRARAADVNEKASAVGSAKVKLALAVPVDLPSVSVGGKASAQAYRQARSTLTSLEGEVKSLRGDAVSRERAVQQEMRRYMERECARFTDTSG